MPERGIANAPPAVVVVPMGIGLWIEQLALHLLEIIAQAFILQWQVSKDIIHLIHTRTHTHREVEALTMVVRIEI